jgi:hypothetical protein
MKRLPIFVAVLCLLAFLGPVPKAQSATPNVLQEYLDWVQKKPKGPGSYSLRFVLVSNQSNNLVGYTEGSLTLGPIRSSGVFKGDGVQYFSDRQWGTPFPSNPFDPKKTDRLGLSIDADDARIILTLKSWGNTQIHIDTVQTANGVFYGFGDTAPIKSLFVLSLKKVFLPDIH